MHAYPRQGDEHIDGAANATAVRTVRLAEFLAERAPGAGVIVLGLLPRGDLTLHPEEAALRLPSKCAGCLLPPALSTVQKPVSLRVQAGGRQQHAGCQQHPWYMC